MHSLCPLIERRLEGASSGSETSGYEGLPRRICFVSPYHYPFGWCRNVDDGSQWPIYHVELDLGSTLHHLAGVSVWCEFFVVGCSLVSDLNGTCLLSLSLFPSGTVWSSVRSLHPMSSSHGARPFWSCVDRQGRCDRSFSARLSLFVHLAPLPHLPEDTLVSW